MDLASAFQTTNRKKYKIKPTGYISVKMKVFFRYTILFDMFEESEMKLCFTLESVGLKFPPNPKRFNYPSI